ncbi:unnamed protein product [Alternaria alternata]
MAKLWLKDSTPNNNGTEVIGDIIAVRRRGGPKTNYNYLLTSSIRKPPSTEGENPEATNDLLESGIWYWPSRVTQEAKKTWNGLENKVSMLELNLDIKSDLNRFSVFLVRIDSDKVNPLYGVANWEWEAIGKPLDIIRFHAETKSAAITLPEVTVDNAVADRESSTSSEKQMLEAILRRAKNSSGWSICGKNDYGIYDQEDYQKARTLSLKAAAEVLKAAFNHHKEPCNLTEKQGEGLSSIRLHFVGRVDPLSPPSRSSDIAREGPEIFPTLMFKDVFDDLQSWSAENLLGLNQTEREGFVNSIVRQAPHMLQGRHGVLPLVLVLRSEEGLGRELQACNIQVEDEWYERSHQEILLMLSTSLKDELPELEVSEIHATWESLKRIIQANDNEQNAAII